MKTFKDFINEEGYDRLRDQGRVRPSKDKKDATTMPMSDEVKKTQKVNKGPSAFEIVKKKYGKSVMNMDKKIMPAVSKAQQKFFGIVRAIQKGEIEPTTPETAKAAATMKKKDVKDFASTDHKGLPEKKKEVNETVYYKSDSKYQKKISDENKRNKEKDKRMKFGKFSMPRQRKQKNVFVLAK